jgi:hypothetical protein
MSMGLCIPNECDNSDLLEILPDMLYLINSLAIPYEFSHIKEKNDTMPELTIDDLEFVSVEELNQEVTTIKFGNVIMIFIIGFIGVAVIGSTFVTWSEEKKIIKEKLLEKA